MTRTALFLLTALFFLIINALAETDPDIQKPLHEVLDGERGILGKAYDKANKKHSEDGAGDENKSMGNERRETKEGAKQGEEDVGQEEEEEEEENIEPGDIDEEGTEHGEDVKQESGKSNSQSNPKDSKENIATDAASTASASKKDEL